MGSGATGHGRGGAVVRLQSHLPRYAARRTPRMEMSATAGAVWPPMARARAADGRLADKHGATRGAAAPLAMGAIEAFRLPCLGLLGV
jgi:nitrate/nitrite transporter NarK